MGFKDKASPPALSQRTGAAVEHAALVYLQNQGLRCVARNFTSRNGEIDLIMRSDDCLVFVEVRYRRSLRFGGGAASITRDKQSRLVRTAEYFLLRYPRYRKMPCRFDVVAASGESAWSRDELRRVTGALSTPRLNADVEVALTQRESEVLRQLKEVACLARERGRRLLLLSSRRWQRIQTSVVDEILGRPAQTWRFGGWWAVAYETEGVEGCPSPS